VIWPANEQLIIAVNKIFQFLPGARARLVAQRGGHTNNTVTNILDSLGAVEQAALGCLESVSQVCTKFLLILLLYLLN
jgi:hypothetical protein